MKTLRHITLFLTLSWQTLRTFTFCLFWIFCLSFLAHFCYYMHLRCPKHWDITAHLLLCSLCSFAPTWLPLPALSWMGLTLPLAHALYHPSVVYAARHITACYSIQSAQSAWFGFCVCGICLLGSIILQKRKSQQAPTCITARRFRWILRFKRKTSRIRLHRLPLVKGTEAQHILFVGTTGSGKSNALYHLLDSLRANKHRAIIVDSTGLVAQHYKSPHDIYFNPSEPDTDAWKLFEDYANDEDFAHFANTMIPTAHNQEPFWSHASQTVLRTLLSLSLTGGLPQLQRLLFHTPLANLIDILSTTPAQTLLTKEADKTAGSIVAHLNSAAKPVRRFSSTVSSGKISRPWGT